MEKDLHYSLLFGKNLKRLRKEKGMTQVDLAYDAGLEPSYMTKLENGKAEPKLSTIVALAVALGVTPAELLAQ